MRLGVQHKKGTDIPEDAKPAEIMLESHRGSQSWLWIVHAAF